jgi:hypothetical protein
VWPDGIDHGNVSVTIARGLLALEMWIKPAIQGMKLNQIVQGG